MEKIKCGGLIERGDLCLVEVLGYHWSPGLACGILGKFGQAGMPLSYLSIGRGADGNKNMSFCVGTMAMAANRGIIEEIQTEFSPDSIEVKAPVTILILYGPHFMERHTLASEVFSALCVDGIDALTVCSSVNSISVVINIPDRDHTVECFKQRFEWPE